MTTTPISVVPQDPNDRRTALGATGSLRQFNLAGVLEAADVHVATRLGALVDETDDAVLLAVALTVRAARSGGVCIDLATAADQDYETDAELTWPGDDWRERVVRSPLTDEVDPAAGPVEAVLRLEGDRLYLDRHWREEVQVSADLVARIGDQAALTDDVETAAERLFPAGWEPNRLAGTTAVRNSTMVLTGGPGTGKTASIARLLALLSETFEREHGRPPRIALAAPTGKAAARMQEAIAAEATKLTDPADAARLDGLRAVTIHGMLGWRPGNRSRFRHHRGNPLPVDVVVIDEMSMVSLAQMARILEAVPTSARLVLVGDKDQLASVEAGAVLGHLVRGLREVRPELVVELKVTYRTRVGGVDDAGVALDTLAEALRDGKAADALAVLRSGNPAVRLVDPDKDVAEMATVRATVEAFARNLVRLASGDEDDANVPAVLAEVDRVRLLCAHRDGPYGVSTWNRTVERMLFGNGFVPEWYAGRPVLLTANDRGLKVSNGDLGVVVSTDDDKLRVALRTADETKVLAPTRLSGLETVYAMTIHKSQGSEADEVIVVLPPEDSRLLTRELFYTGVTRAKKKVTIVGDEDALAAALARPVERDSGLEERLVAGLTAKAP